MNRTSEFESLWKPGCPADLSLRDNLMLACLRAKGRDVFQSNQYKFTNTQSWSKHLTVTIVGVITLDQLTETAKWVKRNQV